MPVKIVTSEVGAIKFYVGQKVWIDVADGDADAFEVRRVDAGSRELLVRADDGVEEIWTFDIVAKAEVVDL